MPEQTAEEKRSEFVSRFKEFLRKKYYKDLVKAAHSDEILNVDFQVLDKASPEMTEFLLEEPELFFDIAKEAADSIELPAQVVIRFFNLPESSIIPIRNLRSKHIGRLTSVEGIVRKSSEIRPEIIGIIWKCPQCDNEIEVERKGNFIGKPFMCDCGNKAGFTQKEKRMIDMRWIVIEEPFELTEGEKPSQVTLVLKEGLTTPEFRRMTDPGNRLIMTGVLREIPKGKFYNVKLDFYVDVNHIEPKETGWERVEVTKEDEKEIIAMSKDPEVYKKLVASLAPTLYGLDPIKESIILQMFGGNHRQMADGTRSRGDIHILIVGDPAAGKSQLLKLAPEIVPRGKYVSGKGTSAAGLTASVTKDEQFMGGWVLEAGAMVLANKGLLSVDEFEKMSVEDQVAMHEGLEQGSVSIAKASIVATLPAKTSVLAGGNPKFSRFDPYMPISKQITIPETLLSRFDLKFALRDVPDAKKDKRVVDHMLSSREHDYEAAIPVLPAEKIRKYISYVKNNCNPILTKEAGKVLRNFYLKTRRRAEGGGAMSITLRQFEALIRLSEAAAKVQLSQEVKKEHAMRSIKLMKESLRQLGFDPDTGEIDIDRAEGGVTAKERSGIRVVMDIINKLSEDKKEIPIDEIREAAKKENITEDQVEEILTKLKNEGMLFNPNPNYIQKV